MAAQVGVTLVKRFTYRGDASEEWSNQYWLTGAIPADNTAWKALADALIAQEKTVYHAASSVIRAYGYSSDADNAVSVWSYDYLAATASVPGTFNATTLQQTSGDQAAWVRWKTNRLNTRGKSIYLRKYFHSVVLNATSGATIDNLPSSWLTAANAFGTKLRDGSFLDARTITARGHTDTIALSSAGAYITTRTLKRRGKRPGA